MHEAGFVHRDLKPANVMWLPRANHWTVIDFGCAARIGALPLLSFTLACAAPEVVLAFEMGAKSIESSPALDAWSLGVMAFELFTGSPAFRLVTDGRARVWPSVIVLLLLVLSRVDGYTRTCGCTQKVVCIHRPCDFMTSAI
jgi:serine/threonine protein kinase